MKHLVLLVDSEEKNQKLIGHHLVTRGGHSMIPVKNPNEGIAQLKKRKDITIVIAAHKTGDDSIKTESSGLNALAFAKKNNPTVATTILIATQVTDKLRRAAAKLGIDKVTEYGSPLQQVLEDAELTPRSTRILKPGEFIING